MKDATTVYECSHIGVAGTTKTFIKRTGERYVARVGIAIMGSTNMPSDELETANPFDDSFCDNFAEGIGNTGQEAIAALKKDMQQTANTLW